MYTIAPTLLLNNVEPQVSLYRLTYNISTTNDINNLIFKGDREHNIIFPLHCYMENFTQKTNQRDAQVQYTCIVYTSVQQSNTKCSFERKKIIQMKNSV